ncbi:MAG: hypothetical protein Q4B73_04700, partial [Lachnospiraceae bacterium]|nr:hypothetical protein [Lachnospiraceae bacterium]
PDFSCSCLPSGNLTSLYTLGFPDFSCSYLPSGNLTSHKPNDDTATGIISKLAGLQALRKSFSPCLGTTITTMSKLAGPNGPAQIYLNQSGHHNRREKGCCRIATAPF